MKEVWRDVTDFEGHYQVSNLGRVRSLDRTIVDSKGVTRNRKGRIIKLNLKPSGYVNVNLQKGSNRKYFRVHRLVAQEFIDNPNSYPEVNHINGIKDDNRAENLEWCTSSQNQKHAIELGLNVVAKGSKCSYAILDEEKVRKIILSKGKSDRELGEIYGVSAGTIRDARIGRNWKHVYKQMKEEGLI